MSQILQALGRPVDRIQIEKEMSAGDCDGDGAMDFTEFWDFVMRTRIPLSDQIAEFKRLFALFDADGSGQVTAVRDVDDADADDCCE